jgi:ankyrin repeat protein
MRGSLLVWVLFSVAMMPACAQTIHEAVVRGDVARVRALIRADPLAIDARDTADGATPLHLAARRNQVEIARLLLSAGANPDSRQDDQRTPLIEAAANSALETAQLLLSSAAGVNRSSSDGTSPLHASALNGSFELTRLLIAAGANVNLRRRDGWTPLHCAAYSGRLDVLRLLLQHGADPMAATVSGDLPIHIAASNHQSAVIGVFLSMGQSVDLPNLHGDTPLIVAARNGQVNVGQYLIGAGADLDHRNDAGRNALEEAVRADQTKFVVLLRHYQTAVAERDERIAARKAAGLQIRTGYERWTAAFTQAKSIYKNDFTIGVAGPEWSTQPGLGESAAPLRISVTPKGERRFLGEFGNQTVRLALNGLPPHTEVSVRFDLYILRAWEGNDLYVGPHVWSFGADDGPLLFNTTFANRLTVMSPNIKMQAFPAEYPGGHQSIQTGTADVNTLGYTFSADGQTTPMDSVYALGFTFPHTAPTLTLKFAAQGLEPLDHTSWGLANVQVSAAQPVNLPPHPVVAIRTARPIARSIVHTSPRRSVRAIVLAPVRHRKPAAPPTTHPAAHRPEARLHAIERPPGL